MASIEDLISYRLKYKTGLPNKSKSLNINKIGKLNFHIYKNKLEKNINFAVTKGKLNQTKSIPVRVLSDKIKNKNIMNNNNIIKSLKVM